MSAATTNKSKATVDDLAAELRSLNERAERFEQYLAHASQAEIRQRAIGTWAFGLGIAWFPLVFAGEMLNTAIERDAGPMNSVNLSIGFALAMLGIFWGQSKMRAG